MPGAEHFNPFEPLFFLKNVWCGMELMIIVTVFMSNSVWPGIDKLWNILQQFSRVMLINGLFSQLTLTKLITYCHK